MLEMLNNRSRTDWGSTSTTIGLHMRAFLKRGRPLSLVLSLRVIKKCFIILIGSIPTESSKSETGGLQVSLKTNLGLSSTGRTRFNSSTSPSAQVTLKMVNLMESVHYNMTIKQQLKLSSAKA